MTVFVKARYEDMSIGIVASYDVAAERARDLVRLGWDVEMIDEDRNPVEWDWAENA